MLGEQIWLEGDHRGTCRQGNLVNSGNEVHETNGFYELQKRMRAWAKEPPDSECDTGGRAIDPAPCPLTTWTTVSSSDVKCIAF